jgi:hypothetical protein
MLSCFICSPKFDAIALEKVRPAHMPGITKRAIADERDSDD